MSTPDAEILVHITAPARAADDAKYRTLANAYLNFEPTSRTSVTLELGGQSSLWGASGRGKENDVGKPPQESHVPRSTGEADPGIIESPMLSFRSAINNLGSPRLHRLDDGGIEESQPSWQPPPSVIQDSMPDNDLAFPQYCTPTRILTHYTSIFDSSQSDISPVAQRQARLHPNQSGPPEVVPLALGLSSEAGSVGLPGTGGATDSPGLFDCGVPPATSSQCPTGASTSSGSPPDDDGQGTVIPLSPIPGDKRPAPASPSPTNIAEQARVASSYQDQPTPTSRAESEPPLFKRPRLCHDPQPGKPLARSASDVGPRQAGTNRHQPEFPVPDCLEILSPPPATAQKELRPEDMVTDVLAGLARELDLERRFKPQSQARDMRPFERGYWLVDCSTWEPALKRSAWSFLADYLGKGAAGWGTSCRRDPDFSWIRLYCWGCIVGHMYLVLYLMSKRKVLYTGVSWIGADGNPVVVMGARPAPK